MVAVGTILAPISQTMGKLKIFADAKASMGVPVPDDNQLNALANACNSVTSVAAQLAQNSGDREFQQKMVNGALRVREATAAFVVAFQTLRTMGFDEEDECRARAGLACDAILSSLQDVLEKADEVEVRQMVVYLEDAKRAAQFIGLASNLSDFLAGVQAAGTAFKQAQEAIEKRLVDDLNYNHRCHLRAALAAVKEHAMHAIVAAQACLSKGATSLQPARQLLSDHIARTLQNAAAVLMKGTESCVDVDFARLSKAEQFNVWLQELQTVIKYAHTDVQGSYDRSDSLDSVISRTTTREMDDIAVYPLEYQTPLQALCERIHMETEMATVSTYDAESMLEAAEELRMKMFEFFNQSLGYGKKHGHAVLDGLQIAVVTAIQSATAGVINDNVFQAVLDSLVSVESGLSVVAGYTERPCLLLVECEILTFRAKFIHSLLEAVAVGGDGEAKNMVLQALACLKASLTSTKETIDASICDISTDTPAASKITLAVATRDHVAETKKDIDQQILDSLADFTAPEPQERKSRGISLTVEQEILESLTEASVYSDSGTPGVSPAVSRSGSVSRPQSHLSTGAAAGGSERGSTQYLSPTTHANPPAHLRVQSTRNSARLSGASVASETTVVGTPPTLEDYGLNDDPAVLDLLGDLLADPAIDEEESEEWEGIDVSVAE